MPEPMKAGCARPTGSGPTKEDTAPILQESSPEKPKEVNMIKVGQKAPDFTAPAYHKGEFVNIQLSEFLGKWVVLCFYPGDFTFV